jgi:UDP-N-acetylmuramoyl-tripeptide--D-alanyl-D-alanine ligase
MPRHTRAAVFEMGMNHAGEIAPLSALVRPHAVAVTTVEAAHVENFPDGEAGVARAKAEIFEGLEPGGAAILNADNRWFDALEARARTRGARVLTFGEASGCEARLLGFELTRTGARVDAELHGAAISYDLHHRARHWGPMSLCALLMMGELGVALETALGALADLRPLAGRGAERILTIDGGEVVLIDESYNASPVSVRAALQSLGERPAAGRRIAALTDMLELGPDGPDQHVALAQAAQSSGVNLVFCAGPLMLRLYEAIDPTRRGGYAQDAEALAAVLAPALEPGDVVMVKGSHASRASVIVERLAAGASAARDEA